MKQSIKSRNALVHPSAATDRPPAHSPGRTAGQPDSRTEPDSRMAATVTRALSRLLGGFGSLARTAGQPDSRTAGWRRPLLAFWLLG